MGSGFVSKDMVSEHLPPPAPDTKIMLCGASNSSTWPVALGC